MVPNPRFGGGNHYATNDSLARILRFNLETTKIKHPFEMTMHTVVVEQCLLQDPTLDMSCLVDFEYNSNHLIAVGTHTGHLYLYKIRTYPELCLDWMHTETLHGKSIQQLHYFKDLNILFLLSSILFFMFFVFADASRWSPLVFRCD